MRLSRISPACRALLLRVGGRSGNGSSRLARAGRRAPRAGVCLPRVSTSAKMPPSHPWGGFFVPRMKALPDLWAASIAESVLIMSFVVDGKRFVAARATSLPPRVTSSPGCARLRVLQGLHCHNRGMFRSTPSLPANVPFRPLCFVPPA